MAQEQGHRPPQTGLLSFLPARWVPFAELMRLDRPAGWFAFYWPYALGLAFSATLSERILTPIELLKLAGYLAAWMVVLRGATCAINDIFDQEYDRKVARTRSRPLARGAVSTAEATAFTVLLYLVEVVMLLPLPSPVMMYAVLTNTILSVYPLGKRVTDFPQVILGFGFAVAVPLAVAVVEVDPLAGENRTAVLSLCGVCVLWTIVFDTVYAFQDITDDVKVGVRSLAIYLGRNAKLVFSVLATCQTALLVALGCQYAFSLVYFALSCAGTGLTLICMLVWVDLEVPSSCAWWFGPGAVLVEAFMISGFVVEYARRYCLVGL
ncbi:putative 4-hydroxybenzoate polyprenyl transferase [Aspergillus ellipticus CBS 707.79]|uniref:Putative 4-hydroxybenzoate polyprenyl transferase n=1 Tax=Aspergillus ellipticus CBS 707.79 TaxID=1448320 RepID=A0A319D1C0_9EURO|nr:putative 4-hydroxybenzoate polyprenyl transferase [Aspergillus ellipticus CBS 707.79]